MKAGKISSDDVKIFKANLVFALMFGALLLFTALFIFFGKDYLIDSGKIAFIAGSIAFFFAISFVFIRLQTRFVAVATELRRTAEEEEFERNRTLTLINSIKDAVILVDDGGYVSLYNAATLDMLDTNVSISRMLVSEVIKPTQETAFDLKGLMDTLKGSKEVQFKAAKHDGQVLDLKMTISRARSGYGKVGMRGFVLVIRQMESQEGSKSSQFIHDARNNMAVVEGSIENTIVMIAGDNKDGAKRALTTALKALADFKKKIF